LKSLTVQEWTCQWAADVLETGKGTFRRILGSEIAFVDYGVLPRSVECAVSCLHLRHAGVYAHLARFNLANSSKCSVCNVEDTIEHFILHYTLFSNQQRDFCSRLEGLSLQWDLFSALGGGDAPTRRRTAAIHHLGQYLLSCNMVTKL
jgi:hypothetical protein